MCFLSLWLKPTWHQYVYDLKFPSSDITEKERRSHKVSIKWHFVFSFCSISCTQLETETFFLPFDYEINWLIEVWWGINSISPAAIMFFFRVCYVRYSCIPSFDLLCLNIPFWGPISNLCLRKSVNFAKETFFYNKHTNACTHARKHVLFYSNKHNFDCMCKQVVTECAVHPRTHTHTLTLAKRLYWSHEQTFYDSITIEIDRCSMNFEHTDRFRFFYRCSGVIVQRIQYWTVFLFGCPQLYRFNFT